MTKDLPIWLIEPRHEEKRKLLYARLSGIAQGAGYVRQTHGIDDIKRDLRKIREYARDNMSSLVEELKTNLSQNYPHVNIMLASDDSEAARSITEISKGIRTISTNNSSIVLRELKPGLVNKGFTVINSYLNEFDIEERRIVDYWDLPQWPDNDPASAFDISMKMSGIDLAGIGEIKKHLVVLGVNAISAEDGTVFFLQHFSNIYKDLAQAETVILVVGLDKIVKSRQNAAFQTKCVGIFGKDNVLLAMQPKADKTPAIAELPPPRGDQERELHLIILDNGRSNFLRSKFSDLFLCIGCRACNNHCPVRRFVANDDPIWTPRNCLCQFLSGTSNQIDVCLHCEGCRIDCPLDIDLPGLMWQANTDYINKHGRSFHSKILGTPETLAKLGTGFAPAANWMTNTKAIRVLMEALTGIDKRTTLPKFQAQTFRKRYKKNAGRSN